MGHEHLNQAGPLTKKTLAKLRFFEELDYRDFMNPSRASSALPIVSCGYKYCSALILVHPSAVALSHMLTISDRSTALEYVDDMLERFERLLGSRPEGREVKGFLVAGAGQDHILAACVDRGIRTEAPNVFWDGGTRDVIVYPTQLRAEIYTESRCTELKLA